MEFLLNTQLAAAQTQTAASATRASMISSDF